jgi:hypothetical protein
MKTTTSAVARHLTLTTQTSAPKAAQTGTTTVEYTLCASMLVALLFAPLPEAFDTNGRSLMDMMYDAIQRNHALKVKAIASPVVGVCVDIDGGNPECQQ